VSDKDAEIWRHDAFYRRGLVLGLTMAEIMVLILFALLLAIAATLSSKDQEINAKGVRIAELAAVETQLGELQRQNQSGVAVEDIIRRVERQQREIALLEREIERLKSFERSGVLVDDIVKELRRQGVASVTAAAVVQELQRARDLVREHDNLRGQNKQLSDQIRRSGKGNEFPSCWATPEGKIESIFEITISESGIMVVDRDRALPAQRTEDRTRLPLSMVRYRENLPLPEFAKQLRPLYLWSVQEGCRFYVIRFSSRQEVRAELVNAVDDFFYPDSRIHVRPAN
jgi:hypothetical protein